MQDITHYSDNELSLLVFNTKWLRDLRNRAGFKDIIDTLFIYTHAQWNVLMQDINDDNENNEKQKRVA